MNDKLDWSDQVTKGSTSIMSQLKIICRAVLKLAERTSKTFAKTYANAIFYCKLNYHLKLWGSCTRGQKTMINNTILKIATKLSNHGYGRTNEFYLKEMKWLSIDNLYKSAIMNITHKILNDPQTNNHYFYTKLTTNRTTRKIAENKTGPKPIHDRLDKLTIKLFTYNTIDCYNNLHRSITLTQSKKFKTYLKNYLLDNKLPTIPKNQKDNNKPNGHFSNNTLINCNE